MKNTNLSLITFFMLFLGLLGWGQNNVPISSLPVADTLGYPDFYPVVQNGHYKRVNVSVISTQLDSFVNSKVLTGPTGAQGATGVTGATGNTGATGATGASHWSLNAGLLTPTDTTNYVGIGTANPKFAFEAVYHNQNYIFFGNAYNAGLGSAADTNVVAFGNPYTGNLFFNNVSGGETDVYASKEIQLSSPNVVFPGDSVLFLHNIRIPTGAGSHYFLSSDSFGNATWQPVDLDSSAILNFAWGLGGNNLTGLSVSPQIGTKDTFDFYFICSGDQSGHIWHKMENTAFGREALNQNSSGDYNSAFGYQALRNNFTGINNTGIGNSALWNDTSGSSNTGLGQNALFYNLIGSFNTACGTASLAGNISGNYNTAVGFGSNIEYDTISNSTAIGANAVVGESFAVSIGNISVPLYVGIGTSTPQAMLDIELTSGQAGEVAFKLADGTQGTGKVLTSDSGGNASWAVPFITAAQLSTLYPALSHYANDAAASTAGLTTGQPYINSATFALTFKQ